MTDFMMNVIPNPIKTKPIVWSISGSDCSGGAGIAADIKTGHALGVEVCYLITANTVQSSTQLTAVNPVDVSILQQQVDVLSEDKPPAVIKVGLLANLSQVRWLTGMLVSLKANNNKLKVIYDPVGQASVGGNLSNLTVNELKPLLPLVDVITPNSYEAKILAHSDTVHLNILAKNILKLGVNSIIIKGGHHLDDSVETKANSTCFDYCLHRLTDSDSSKMSTDETIEYGLNSLSINTDYSHGGGCSFASALAAFVAHGYLVRDAFTLTKSFINKGLLANQNKYDHYGAFEQTTWPTEPQYFPSICSVVNSRYSELPAFKSLGFTRSSNSSISKLGLYPVINSLYWLERLLPLGLNIIQLRIKNKSENELNTIIQQAVEMSKRYDTRLFINDHWQLAIKHGAYGVHIGQEDLQTTPLNTIHQAGLRLGISTHGCYEFLMAQQLKPSYLAIGAIYPTKTKNMTGQIQGVESLAHILKLSTDIPVVAIGGINHERAPCVLSTGVDSIAVVTAITEAESPEKSVELLSKIISNS